MTRTVDRRLSPYGEALSVGAGWSGPEEALATAADIMTTPAVACREDAFFEEVTDFLDELKISGMPVVNDEGVVVGVVSERDLAAVLGDPLVRQTLRRHQHGPTRREAGIVPREARRAKHIMTKPPTVNQTDASIDELARAMVVERINRIPIVDHEGRLVGVVTRGDILAALAGVAHGVRASGETVVVGSCAEAIAQRPLEGFKVSTVG
jgi:CBS domain-containing protein